MFSMLPSFGQDDVAQDTPDHFRATSIQSCLYASCSATQWNRLTVTCCYVFEHPQQILLVRRVKCLVCSLLNSGTTRTLALTIQIIPSGVEEKVLYFRPINLLHGAQLLSSLKQFTHHCN